VIARRELAAVRKLLNAEDWDTVSQGVERIIAADDPELMALMREGVHADSYQLYWDKDAELVKRVRYRFRLSVALRLLVADGALQQHERLVINHCAPKTQLKPLAALPALRNVSLTLTGVHASLNLLKPLSKLSELYLKAEEGHKLTRLAPLRTFKRLEALSLDGFSELTDLSPIQKLTGLRRLSLRDCERLQDLSPISSYADLQLLYLEALPAVTDLSPLRAFSSLQTLVLECLAPNVSFAPVADLSALTRLEFLSNRLTDVSFLRGMTALKTLRIRWAYGGFTLAPLVGLGALEALDLENSDLADLSPLTTLPRLRQLTLHDLQSLTDFSSMSGLVGLESLYISAAPHLTDLSCLRGLAALQHFMLASDVIDDVTPLVDLPALEEVHLMSCHGLPQSLRQEFSGEARIRTLKKRLA